MFKWGNPRNIFVSIESIELLNKDIHSSFSGAEPEPVGTVKVRNFLP
jgi:hypothetical protein